MYYRIPPSLQSMNTRQDFFDTDIPSGEQVRLSPAPGSY